MSGLYSRTSENPRPEWRETKWGLELNRTMMLAGSNGTDAGIFGEVKAGTILEVLDDKRVRPAVLTTVQAAVSDDTDVEVGTAANVYPGDEVNFAPSADILPFLINSFTTSTVKFTGKDVDLGYTIEIIDPGGADTLEVVVTLGNPLHVAVTLGHDGGAITSTIEDVVDAINDSDSTPYMLAEITDGDGSDLAIALAETALSLGATAGELLLGAAATVVSVNKTTNVVTLGGNVTVPAGYVLRLHDSSKRIAGILEDQPNTMRLEGGVVVARDESVQVAREALMRSAKLTGFDEAMIPYLLFRGPLVTFVGAWGFEIEPQLGTFIIAD